MPFDPTKPVQDRRGKQAEIIAVGITDQIYAAGKFPGYRYEGQTILAVVEGIHRWFYENGGFTYRDRQDVADLINAPVVVKGRRRVTINDNGDVVTFPVSTTWRSDVVGTVEFTVTDGKLTNVEIVNESDC